jgi:hypothetical protein
MKKFQTKLEHLYEFYQKGILLYTLNFSSFHLFSGLLMEKRKIDGDIAPKI